MPKTQLTYLFGAGASAQSMPLVESFVDRYRDYLKFLQSAGYDNAFIKYNKRFLDELTSHFSVDTLFKKLFHQDQNNLVLDYKYFLFLYLLYEHIADIKTINQFIPLGTSIHKKYNLDPRYEALIAGLLKPIPGKSQPFCDVTFLTWNYDLNLLYSIYNFISRENTFSEFLNKARREENIFECSKEIKVIHLNGYIGSKHISTFGSSDIPKLLPIFGSLIWSYEDADQVREYTRSIKFAWETFGQENKPPDFVLQAIAAINQSHSIIITGYSFPLYNRLIDQALLSVKDLHGATLYISDPQAEDKKRLLHSDFNFPLNPDRKGIPQAAAPPLIVASTSYQNFIVPSNVFQLR